MSAIIANDEEIKSLRSEKKYKNAQTIDAGDNFNPVTFYQYHQNKRLKTYFLESENPLDVFEQFKQNFEMVEAAGGIVFNEDGEVIMIYRRGCWDFPKGKIDPGEDKQKTALREVSEETGLKNLEITGKQNFEELDQEGTLHLYQQDGSNVLKLTYWYEMKGTMKDELIPEEREGIERVKWVKPMYLPAYLDNSFLSVKDLAFRYC